MSSSFEHHPNDPTLSDSISPAFGKTSKEHQQLQRNYDDAENESGFFVDRKNLLVSKICSVQKRSKNFFQRRWHRNRGDGERKQMAGFPCKVQVQARKTFFSLNLFETDESKSVAHTSDVNIQFLTPQNVRCKANSFPRTKCQETTSRTNTRTNCNAFNRNTVLRKLSKEEFKFVEKTFIKKRCSMCFLLDCGGIENSAFFLQQSNKVISGDS